jgi:hypothetical protein
MPADLMFNRFYSLRHDRIICGHQKDSHIGGLTTRRHGENAAWPGVSIKVIFTFVFNLVAPMAWVMPPFTGAHSA